MSSKPDQPPVPPANRTPFGPGAEPAEGKLSEQEVEAIRSGQDRNLDQQGRQGNIKQNTTNQGLKQAR